MFEDHHGDVLTNPVAVVEVLSPSTEAFDRGEKFRRYRTVPSLREYVLVSQSGAAVEVFSRQTDGGWVLADHEGLDAVALLPWLEASLPLAEVYDRVKFEEGPPSTSG